MTQTQTASSAAQQTAPRQQAVHFGLYKLRPAWWQLDMAQRRRLSEEFLQLLQRWQDRLLLESYSLVGLRADSDFLLWKAAESVEELHEVGLDIASSGLGAYLDTPYAYLSLTKRSVYVREHEHEGQEGTRLRIAPIGARYLFVYPFVKTRAWYALPLERRQQLMNEHIRVGHKYPSVRLNTTYSFGLDDQEFVLAFETDQPGDFLDLVMELRETEASAYTLRDTPIFSCIKASGTDLLRTLSAS